jgi:spore germination protein
MRQLGTGMEKSLVVTALVAVASMLGSSAVAEPQLHARARLAVTGYILDGSSTNLVDREAHALRTLGVDGVSLASSGRRVGKPSAGSLKLMERAHHDGVRAELLMSNFDQKIGDFSPMTGSRLLRHDAHIAHVSKQLALDVRRQGWDGITVDLESLRRADRAGLTKFVRALQAKMPAAKTVSVDLMASTDTADYQARGYQLRPLSHAADVLALMTYDQHGPGWSGPGPIGALMWQRRSVQALTAKVPAGMVDLGVAGYGYSWPTGHTGRSYTVAAARKIVASDGARPVWHAHQGEWSATLSNGTVLWWSDLRSWRLRVKLARHLGLHGLALWRLGSADPLPH